MAGSSSLRSNAPAASTTLQERLRLRPLPPLPLQVTGNNQPSLRRATTEPTQRPLPLPPLVSQPSPSPSSSSSCLTSCSESTQESVEICITPATPLPTSSSSAESPQPQAWKPPGHIIPLTPSSPNKRPSLAALTVQTSPAALLPTTRRRDSSMLTPLTPNIPQAPSPATARKKRAAKIRRQLGVGVPTELLEGTKNQSFPKRAPVLPRAAVANNNSDDEDDENASWTDVEEHISLPWAKPPTDLPRREKPQLDFERLHARNKMPLLKLSTLPASTHRPSTRKRLSSKWMREKGGHRWVENDYNDVIAALRQL